MEKHIDFSYSARYFQLGELNASTKQVIFALHGYGQQAKYFIRKFDHLTKNNICIIAPEGLNRFYLEGFSGRVGATWMTKEDREADIRNYVAYLNSIYTSLNLYDSKISILGFSQGAATASRWISRGQVDFSSLILWAGIFPPDMNLENSTTVLKNKKITYVYGKQDKFITEDRIKEMDQISADLAVTPQVLTFNGEHHLDEDVLTQIFVNNS